MLCVSLGFCKLGKLNFNLGVLRICLAHYQALSIDDAWVGGFVDSDRADIEALA
tara:strand:+ start:103186 stop:103347 length:162 start_codon:yes stop_codon:yes gene_type:complete